MCYKSKVRKDFFSREKWKRLEETISLRRPWSFVVFQALLQISDELSKFRFSWNENLFSFQSCRNTKRKIIERGQLRNLDRLAQVAGNLQNMTWSIILSSKCVGWVVCDYKNPHLLEKNLQTRFAGLCNLCHPASRLQIRFPNSVSVGTNQFGWESEEMQCLISCFENLWRATTPI